MIWYGRDGVEIGADEAVDCLGDPTYWLVVRTAITDSGDPRLAFEVSTIWLGVDFSDDADGPPQLFETAIIRADGCAATVQRYPTETEARAGHAALVDTVAGYMVDPATSDLTKQVADAYRLDP